MSRSIHAAWILLLAGVSQAAPLQFSADIALPVGNGSAPDHGYLLDDGSGAIGFVVPASIPADADLDALDIRDDDTVLFSLDKNGLASGVYAERGDVVSCRYASCALAFDASAAGLPAGIDVDAVATRAGHLLLSFTPGFTHAPLGYIAAHDVVEFDGSGFVGVAFDGADAAVPTNANLDALHVLADGHLLVSFDRTLVLGDVTAFDHDVVEFAPDTRRFTLLRSLGGGNAAWWTADLDAISGAAVADRLFRDGFD
ncbi:MAG TPA: hypothetical protein PLB00_07895 [Pseudomonadota bacterium]|nr:hypothetical protein [Pseudomonadota bacterium]